jgi:hypothetical protein
MNNLFKNEALCLLAIHNFISHSGALSLEKVYLVAPLLFDIKIRGYFKRKNTNIVSVQDVVTSRSDMFIGFNEKYKDLLITTTNALLMGVELGVFKLHEDSLKPITTFSHSPELISKIFLDIALATPNAVRFIEEPSCNVFSLLRIEI